MLEQTPSIQALVESKAHRLASLWEITKTDSTTLYYTDHITSLNYDGNVYQPISVGGKSAKRSPLGLRERNMSFLGYLADTAITERDLRAGRYNNAQVTEIVVDWRYPWQGAILTSVYFITELLYNGEGWEAELNGLTTKLRQPVGRVMGRRCSWALGDSNCSVDVAALTVSSTITAIDTQRRVFQTGLTQVNGYFDHGLLVWTSGNNSGYANVEVERYLNSNGQVSLTLPTVFDLTIGDGFNVYPGCSKTLNACKGTSGVEGRPWTTNVSNFGGFPHIPGNQTALLTPNTR